VTRDRQVFCEICNCGTELDVDSIRAIEQTVQEVLKKDLTGRAVEESLQGIGSFEGSQQSYHEFLRIKHSLNGKPGNSQQ